VLWRCWLGGRKGIRPVENWVVGCWCGYLSAERCRLAYGPADATATHCVCIIFIIVLFFQSHLPEATRGRCTEFQMYIAAAVGMWAIISSYLLTNHFRTGQGPCRANLHKWGLAQSPSCDCGQRQTVNLTEREREKQREVYLPCQNITNTYTS